MLIKLIYLCEGVKTGDRTYVDLTIRKGDVVVFEEICGDFNEKYEGEVPEGEVVTVQYSFHDVNYANLELEDLLRYHKIPYDKVWGAGDEYKAGSEYHRIDATGESVVKEFSEDTEGMVCLDDVVEAVKLDRLDRFIDGMVAEFYIISWKEQNDILSN